MTLMRNYRYLLLVPAVISLFAIGALAVWGLKPGIDLTGGSLAIISYDGTRPTAPVLSSNLSDAGFTDFSLREYGTNGYAFRTQSLTPQQQGNLAAYFTNQTATAHVEQITNVGPTIGQELLQKGLIALGLVALCIILFIAFAFRKVSKPVASWKYGIIAIITLIHDILIPTGLFALLGHIENAEVDSLFIVALLTLLGVSINNTIVVFDRIRENLRRNEDMRRKEGFEDTVGRSIMQTLARSINTSLAVVIVLVALYALGPSTTKDFALTLIVGMVAGTYSSIFLASPLLVAWEKWRGKSR
jgi:preprotein translocase subunit SecF